MIWTLIKKFMRETEVANNIAFAESAWQRVKQLESDIKSYIWDEIEKPHIDRDLQSTERIKELELGLGNIRDHKSDFSEVAPDKLLSAYESELRMLQRYAGDILKGIPKQTGQDSA